MAFLSFGSKKNKIRKLIEREEFNEVVEIVSKDKKAVKDLIELLNDQNPGIVGDVLLILAQILESEPGILKPHLTPDLFKKLLGLMEGRNPYVRENAMMLSYQIVRDFPEIALANRKWIIDSIGKGLELGDKNQRGFLLMVIGELKLKELEPAVEGMVDIEDKVILPFEGKKWVKLGDIARETLEKLSS